MADDEEAPKKDINTPVSKEELDELKALQDSRLDLADRLLHLEQQRIRILASAKRIDEQRNELFSSILVSRGISPNAGVNVDASTGEITLAEGEQAPQPPPEA